jgi:hypothetical protein
MTQTNLDKFRHLLTASYACLAAAFFGITLLDIVYARAIRANVNPSVAELIFSYVTDLLLLIAALVFVSGIVAIAAAWDQRASRNLYIASLFILMLGFSTPMLFGVLIQRLQGQFGIGLGAWVRLTESATTAVLAFLGLWEFDPARS